jgi:hypothetical protein
VIEGACRHLIGDRLDTSGARWGLKGAEAVLNLRAVISNGDFDEYWCFQSTGRERLKRGWPVPGRDATQGGPLGKSTEARRE